ncbi:MAG: response regulator [Thermomonas sp.]|uniref:response regulator transcription factor n=1 Tax=Thermomonas sp. TaxID=1971895 RepID=UPI001EC78682|nr:response regulator [Thermomonas sp.]MBV2209393.1 response regulator [Thermomonas sp.]
MPAFPQVAVVEDSPELLADLVEFLQLRGFTASGFESAEAFLASTPESSFDLMLLDVALPGMSGLEVARQLRVQGLPIGIVMLTALDANDEQVKGFNAGADIYLSKRSTLEVIEASCRSLLRRLGKGGGDAAPPAVPAEAPNADAQLFADACSYIDSQLDNPRLTVEGVAHALQCSRTRLYQVFAERDLSVASYARDQRLARSRVLLRDLRLDIGDIALHCGYGDLPAFSKAFKRCFGVAPGEWRAAQTEIAKTL